LEISRTNISRLDGLANFKSLQSLYLRRLKLDTLEPLSGVKGLKLVDLSEVTVSSGPSVAEVTKSLSLRGVDVRPVR
jgi:Leucine-rich repeat (LRR) protein